MEALLKKYYKEANLKGGNALIFEKRAKAIRFLMEEEQLNDDNAMCLVKWVMGSRNDDSEEILTTIEKAFCSYDEAFTIEDEGEMILLSTIILLEYCKQTENQTIPLIILCGQAIDKKISSQSLYVEFRNIISTYQISIRETEEQKKSLKATGLQQLKKTIAAERKDVPDDEIEYTTQQIDKILNVVENLEYNIKVLQSTNDILWNKVMCQREESDVLWWILNGWSVTYQKPFSDMTLEELAVAVPIEIENLSKFDVFPYSTEQIVYSIMKDRDGVDDKISLSSYMKSIDKTIIDGFRINLCVETNVQPILEVLESIKECGTKEEAWKAMMSNKYKINVDNILLSPIEFANHFCLELELMNKIG